jgi:hypothetical protein
MSQEVPIKDDVKRSCDKKKRARGKNELQRFIGANHTPQYQGGPKRPAHHSGKKKTLFEERSIAMERGRQLGMDQARMTHEDMMSRFATARATVQDDRKMLTRAIVNMQLDREWAQELKKMGCQPHA